MARRAEAGCDAEVAAGGAIGYASNNWAALKWYLEQGYLAVDNNLSERTLRAIALGRNAWGDRERSGRTDGGGTLLDRRDVQALGIDSFAFLRDALPALFSLGEAPATTSLLDYLPDRWLEPDAGSTRW